MIDTTVRNPNSIVLVDAEMKWRTERFAGLLLVPLTNDPAFCNIAFRKVNELIFGDSKGPDVSAGGNDDPLHEPEPAAERDAFRRR